MPPEVPRERIVLYAALTALTAVSIDALLPGLREIGAELGAERYESFDDTTEAPEPGEIVFADEAGRAHARRWTNRQGAASAVGASTSKALIVAEALHAGAGADIARVSDTLRQAIHALWPEAAITEHGAA